VLFQDSAKMVTMNKEPVINILLAAYNGENYITEQIHSILKQTYTNWILIIRDDGSSDRTIEIIKLFIERYPEKIKLIKDNLGNLGVRQNFTKLLEYSDADYIMFSDQDDVWLPHKIEITLKKVKELEKIHGSEVPLLLHTDLKVTDRNLKVFSDSYWKYQKINPSKGKYLNRLLIQNTITGCTAMINKKLKDLAIPIPEASIMHDWWLALVSLAFGKIDFIRESTILYRQHGRNDIGAQQWNFTYVFKKAIKFYETEDLKENLLKTQQQAVAFLQRYKKFLNEEDRIKIEVYSEMLHKTFIIKRYLIFKYGFFRIGFIRNLSLLLRV